MAVDVKLLDENGNEVNVSSFADDDGDDTVKPEMVADSEGLTEKDSLDDEEVPEAVIGLGEEEE